MRNLLHGKTAEGLSLSAQYCLGFCYYKVEGVQRDLTQARYWQNRAVRGHNKAKELSLLIKHSFYELRRYYPNGTQFPKNSIPH